jgi:hypothetical protein
MSFGGAALYPYGNIATRRISEFDPGARSWLTGRRADVPAGGNMIGAHARLDSSSGDVYFLPSQRAALMRYSYAADRWSEGWGVHYVRVHSTAAIDPKRRLFVLIGSGAGAPQALKWDLDRPGPATDLRSVTTGDKEIEGAYAPVSISTPGRVCSSPGREVRTSTCSTPRAGDGRAARPRPEIVRCRRRNCPRELMEDSATCRGWTCSS